MYMDGDVTQEVARANHMIHPLLLTLTCHRLLQTVQLQFQFQADSQRAQTKLTNQLIPASWKGFAASQV
jgi:hypothetical protein